MRLRIASLCVGLTLLAWFPVAAGAAPRAATAVMKRAASRVETPAQRLAAGWYAPARSALASPNATQSPPVNDQCAGAINIPCGNVDLSGDSFLATNDYGFADTTLSCTEHSAEGRDVVYKLLAQPGDSLILTYSTSVFDASFYLVSDCADVQDSCVAGSDAGGLGEAEHINYGFKRAGTYYLILDGWGPNGYGTWSLAGRFWSCGLTPPVGDICATASAITCGQSAFNGTTAAAANDYSFASQEASCANSLAAGKDVVYRLNAVAGDSLSVTYASSADGVLYLLGDCSTSNCLAGSDATGVGGAEVLNYRFQFSGKYDLVLDSNDANSSGTYSLTTTLICVNAPPINDLCAGAFTLLCGDPIALTGSTAFAGNEYGLTESGCTGSLAAGPDVVYRLNAVAGDSLSITYGFPYNIQPNTNDAPDASIYLITDCSNPQASCVAGRDETVSGGLETLNYKFLSSGTYYLILDQYDFSITGKWLAAGSFTCAPPLSVGEPGEPEFRLGRPSPNPFLTSSSVRFALTKRGQASLRVYDLAGRAVRTLVDGELDAGDHTATWNARDDSNQPVRAGVYYARLVSAGRVGVRTLIFVR